MKRVFKYLLSGVSLMTFIAATSCATTNDNSSQPQLKIDTFNPGTASIFPVSSSLISGENEVILIDAQFQRNDAEALLKKIKATGKNLTTVYISHVDPDYYFGLDVIVAAYPKVKVLSTATTQAYIKKTMQAKLAHWGKILKTNAPQKLVVPEVVTGDTLYVDGIPVKIIGLNGHDPKHTFLWVPSTKTVLGGVSVFDNMHAWLADSQTPEARQKWYKTLDEIEALNPSRVIPGHFLGRSSMNIASVYFIRQYLTDFEQAAEESKNSKELIATLKQQYKNLGGDPLLELSAKVIKGEIQWP